MRYGRIGGQREKVKTKGFIKPLALGGSKWFSSLMKQNKKAKNYAVFCFAGFFF